MIAIVGCSSPAVPLAEPDAASVPADGATVLDTSPLEILSLGVQGFVLRRGGESIMTAPLFTRQSAFAVTLNLPLSADTAAIDAGIADVATDEVRAVVSGHAHYDHFIDVPHMLTQLPNAAAYTNLSGRHLLAALAPDRPGCSNAAPAPAPTIARSRVIAVDDPLASYVDYTNCPDDRPAGAPLEGRWIDIPNSRIRMMPVCSTHPAQVGPYHFGAGSVDTDLCELPAAASGWLEGRTLSFVIDFLDAAGEPAFRVFYEDAPTDAPVGHVPPHVLAGKQVDVALLCVGSTDSVQNHPGAIVQNLAPRFGLSGHWEDFFQDAGSMPRPIPLLDLDGYMERAAAALPGPADAPLVVDGEPHDDRHLLVQPGSRLQIPLSL